MTTGLRRLRSIRPGLAGGDTFEEYAEKVANELEIDAVGMWQIAPVGRENYGLSGAELADFVRCCLLALLRRGAKPFVVVTAPNGIKTRVVMNKYGTTPEQITNAIISEWLASGTDPEPYDSLWFALPKMIETAMSKKTIDGFELATKTIGQFSFHEFTTLSELHFVSQDASHARYVLELVLESRGRQNGDYALKIRFVDVSGFSLKSIGGGLAQVTGFYIENISDRGWENQNWEIGDYENSTICFRAANVCVLAASPL